VSSTIGVPPTISERLAAMARPAGLTVMRPP
jgi:hypothetical protein